MEYRKPGVGPWFATKCTHGAFDYCSVTLFMRFANQILRYFHLQGLLKEPSPPAPFPLPHSLGDFFVTFSPKQTNNGPPPAAVPELRLRSRPQTHVPLDAAPQTWGLYHRRFVPFWSGHREPVGTIRAHVSWVRRVRGTLPSLVRVKFGHLGGQRKES